VTSDFNNLLIRLGELATERKLQRDEKSKEAQTAADRRRATVLAFNDLQTPFLTICRQKNELLSQKEWRLEAEPIGNNDRAIGSLVARLYESSQTFHEVSDPSTLGFHFLELGGVEAVLWPPNPSIECHEMFEPETVNSALFDEWIDRLLKLQLARG